MHNNLYPDEEIQEVNLTYRPEDDIDDDEETDISDSEQTSSDDEAVEDDARSMNMHDFAGFLFSAEQGLKFMMDGMHKCTI